MTYGVFRVLLLTFSHVRAPWYVVTWHPIITSQTNTHDVTSWHHHYVIGLAYKRHHMVPIGVHLVQSIWLFISGTHACRDSCADAPAFLEPTSFRHNWLGCYYCCECLYHADALKHSRSIPWVPPYSLLVPSLQDLHTFGWCLCALSSLYKVYIIESILPQGWHLVTPCSTHHNSWCPWVGANWIWVAQIVDLIPPRLQPKFSSVVMGKRDTSDMLSYQES